MKITVWNSKWDQSRKSIRYDSPCAHTILLKSPFCPLVWHCFGVACLWCHNFVIDMGCDVTIVYALSFVWMTTKDWSHFGYCLIVLSFIHFSMLYLCVDIYCLCVIRYLKWPCLSCQVILMLYGQSRRRVMVSCFVSHFPIIPPQFLTNFVSCTS